MAFPHEEFFRRISGIHSRIASEALPNVNRVWCRSCGRSEPVDAAECLARGWPKCCGYTMTIDAPAPPATTDSGERREGEK